eukprot:6619848-Prymnesium_polylepis.1
MSGWDNLEGKNTRTGARVVENAKLRHPGHLELDHVVVVSSSLFGTFPGYRMASRDRRVLVRPPDPRLSTASAAPVLTRDAAAGGL